ncbi:hypothetical protein QE374_001525 [Microbacterium sp. SORGH_AS428]|uniref:DUF4232 domain-containing protein n=1 Tax=Microbacterium sp. SORGH_AS_0428 TaxID=3041788 RepID=UPI00285AB7BD|nr:DUF4232 domain-containing protein [Microbacterium sp. SORGH_AS_0428]MDR6199616.1 hypothetical protein [Microbacterium sp. SORGH_AS_0428]
MRSSHRIWWVGGAAGALWLLVVGLAAAVSLTPLQRVQQAALPTPSPYVWSWPAPWSLLSPLIAAVAVAACVAAILHIVRHGSFAATWLAVVSAGAVTGMTIDAQLVFGTLFTHGWALWAVDLGSRAAIGAYWGLLYGWLPALLASHLSRRDALGTAAHGPSRPRAALAVGAAVAALALLVATQTLGGDASQAQVRADQAAAEPAPPDGSIPADPQAEGEPVPERSAGAGVTGEDGCTPDRAMILKGEPDAATGHRGLRLELLNFSDAPCTIEGYPDIAFGDQNGHLLDTTIEHGGSFMATDPGPASVVVPAGSSAVAYLGWDAQSTHGALIARTLWAAVVAGETRGSWPVELDVVAGTTVAVTAWQAPDATP